MSTTKKSSILKFIRATSMLVGFTIAISSYDAEAKLPLNVFKGVTDCFINGKKYLTPTIGMAALDGGIIENIRFYGNFTSAYRISKGVSERDYANDKSNDPIWNMVRILFPSTAGQLSADSTHRFNFGKYVKTPMTVALLLKYTDDIRLGKPVDEEKLKNDIMLSMGYKFQEKMTEPEQINLAYNLLEEDQSSIYKIMTETQLAIDDLNNYMNTQNMNNNLVDQRIIGQAKNELLRNLTRLLKDFNDEKIKSLFIGGIQKLYKVGSYEIKAPNTARTSPVDPDFFYRVKNELLKAKANAENILATTKIEDLVKDIDRKQPKQKFIIDFKQNTLTPLLGSIKNSIMEEQSTEPNFYPEYTPEQIISAFFDYKFSTRGDVKNLLVDLQRLDPLIMNQDALNSLDPADLLTREHLPEIAQKQFYTMDDIIALSTTDIWSMPTPYRVGAPILSNGNTKKYDRKTNSFVGGVFADCVEISIRHLINCFLYNPTKRDFDFDGLNAYRSTLKNITAEQNRDFQAFVNFYKLQSVDLANDGSLNMRSQWNTVAGDLNSANESVQTAIRYRQGNNELDAGFINLMKVFNKVLGVQFEPTPATNATLDKKKEWLEDAFHKVFEALNPHKGYSINLGMDKVRADNREISGIVTITVKDQKGNMLYAFDFRSDPDDHGQLQNYKINEKLKAESYNEKLINFKFNAIGAENAIWLLDKNADVRHSKVQTTPIFYQLFSEGLADNNAKIRFLEKVDQLYDTHKELFLTLEFKEMMKKTVGDLTLNDPDTFNKAARVIMRLSKKVGLEKLIEEAIKTVNMGGDCNLYRLKLNKDSLTLLYWILRVNNNTLTLLALGVNRIGIDGAMELAEALKGNTSLISLNLADNKIGAEGAKALAEVLMENTSLTSLNLTTNNIGVKGAKALAEVLMENTSLTSLNLTTNNIGVEGAKALAEVLMENTSLTSLNLVGNNIGVEGAKALAEALKGNTSLTTLYLGKNKIGAEGASALAEVLKMNTSLTSLNLVENNIGDEGVKVLAEALKGNTSLTTLYLGKNKIGAEGASALAEVLKMNTSLTSLNLEYYYIGVEGTRALKEVWNNGVRDPNNLKFY